MYQAIKIAYILLDQFDQQTTSLATPFLEKQFNITKQISIWFMMSYSLIQSYLLIPLTYILKAFNQKYIVSICSLLLAITYTLLCQSKILVNLIILRYVASIFLNIVGIELDIYLQDIFSLEYRQIYTNITEITISITNLIIPYIIWLLINKIQLMQFYICSAASAILLASICLLLKKKENSRNEIQPKYALEQDEIIKVVLSLLFLTVMITLNHYQYTFLAILCVPFIFLCDIENLRSIQSAQSLAHQLNQSVIPHRFSKQDVSMENALRQLLTLSSSLMQFYIQDNIELSVYLKIFLTLLLASTILKIIYADTLLLLIVYGTETLFNSLVNHYVNRVVLVCNENPQKMVSMSVWRKQVGAVCGAVCGMQSTEVWGSTLVATQLFELIWVGVMNKRKLSDEY